MIQDRTLVAVADNTGAKIGRIFKVLGGSKKRTAGIGDVVILSVQVAEPRKMVKKKEILTAVVVRQKKPFRRTDGSYIRFDDNAVVILSKNAKDPFEPKANRVFGPIPREIVELGYQKIGSMAPEVV